MVDLLSRRLRKSRGGISYFGFPILGQRKYFELSDNDGSGGGKSYVPKYLSIRLSVEFRLSYDLFLQSYLVWHNFSS